MKFQSNRSQMLVSEHTSPLTVSRGLSLLGGSLMICLSVGCASVDKKSGEAEPQTVAPAEQAVEAQEPTQAEVEQAEAESAAKADEMMATLKAPLVEPGGGESAEPSEPAAEAVVENVEPASPMPEQAASEAEVTVAKVEEKVAEKVEEVKKPVVEKVTEVAKPVAPKAIPAERVAVQKGASAKPLSISKKDLPASYDIWELKQGETLLTKDGLVITTPTWEMGKTGYTSQIWLTLKEDEIHVNSSSDIATEVSGMGIRIDGGELIPFTRIAENNIGVVQGEWLDTLSKAKELDIYLGFFPGKKPTSDNFKSSTSLDNLDRMVATYRKLNN